MTIGIDARFWNETGVGRYIRNLVTNLQKIDNQNQYILFTNQKDQQTLNSQLSTSNFQLVPIDVPWHSIKEQLLFPKILNQYNLDLMHFPYFSIPIFYTRPFVVTIHDLILHHHATGEASTKSKLIYYAKLFIYKAIIKSAAQKSKKIIAVSEATKQEISNHLKIPSEKIAVIYEGIDQNLRTNPVIEIFKKHRILQLSPQNDSVTPYFLHVGNLYPHKNIKLLVKAFEQLQKENSPAKLVIVGKQDYFHQKLTQTIKERNLQKQIILLGEVTDEQLAYLYQHALALVSSSLMEGFALPTIEAMSQNCLVLASDIPVHKEICKDSAIYFQSNNPQDLMLKLTQISNNQKSEYQKNIEEGSKLIKKYSWEEMAKETLKIYESCLSVRQSKQMGRS